MTRLNNEFKGIKKRNNVYKKLDLLLEENGYIKVEPDYFEDLEDFTKVNERIKQESMVKVISPSGRISTLRPDITTNIMKQIIPYLNEDSKFKLFYNSTIFRQNKKRIIQSKQFGLEVFGEESEFDVIYLMNRIFNEFKIDFKLDIGNQVFIEDLIKPLDLDYDTKRELKMAIRSKNQKEIDEILQNKNETILKEILTINGSYNEVKNQLLNFGYSKNQIDDILCKNEISIPSNISYDLSLISEYDYYSGIVLQGYMKESSTPVLYGGRYDKLTKQYGKKVKAFGISFDVDAFVKECSI